VTKPEVVAAVQQWQAQGLSAGAIRFRLLCLAELGLKLARKVLAERAD
jgi:hypothetical protein